ncbi:MAG: trigger factor [Alphaproteobacteria bacterium]|nr:trigger factor [Alphaproteobacteria bacterium]
MNVKELKQDGLSHELEITVKAEEIAKHVESRLEELSKTIKMPGFRPGKVPMNLMRQKYGKAVMGEVLEKAVNDSSQKALKKHSITPALQPKIEVKSFDEGKDLVYTMALEALPQVKIKDYKGFKLTKYVAKADDKSIEDALDRIASMRKSSQPIEGKRASKKGDIVVIDFDGRTADDNVKQPGMAAKGHQLELGSGRFIPGFEDQLTGKKAGDDVAVKVTFPEEYHSAELAGRDAIFDVTIHEIREVSDAKIDDEFAKSLGMADLKALRKAVEDQTNKEFNSHSRLRLKKDLLDELDAAYKFDIPKGMKEMELENIMHQVKMDNQQRGVDAEPTDEEKKELEMIADRRVRLGLVLSEIGKENKISVADAELQKAVITEAQKYPGQEKDVFDYFAKNREALESLRAPIYEDKVVDFILELATITEEEVTPEELTAEDETGEPVKPKKKAAAPKKDDKKPAEKKEAKKKPAAKSKKKAS